MSDTPRTDALCTAWTEADKKYGFGTRLTRADDPQDIWDFARQLERELAEAKKPPPCQHTERGGRVDGEKIEWWCQQCGKPMPSGYVSIYGWLGIPK